LGVGRADDDFGTGVGDTDFAAGVTLFGEFPGAIWGAVSKTDRSCVLPVKGGTVAEGIQTMT